MVALLEKDFSARNGNGKKAADDFEFFVITMLGFKLLYSTKYIHSCYIKNHLYVDVIFYLNFLVKRILTFF